MTKKDEGLLEIPAFLRRKKGEVVVPPPAEEAPVEDSWLDDPTELEPVELPDDMHYQRVYYVKGSAPKSWSTRYYVSDPPNAGYSHAFVLGKPDAKRVTIFCPFTLEAFQVPRDAGELTGKADGPELLTKGKVGRIVSIMQRNWRQYQGFGFSRDYDTAALVLKRLGAEVPEQIMRGGEEDTRKKGGKNVGSALLKPVKRTGKRGKFLAWFMEGDCTRSVREAMAEFSMTRSNALSYLYMLQKDHGIGYELVGDLATVHLPDGCDDPFEAEGLGRVKKEEPKKTEEAGDDDDDSWLD